MGQAALRWLGRGGGGGGGGVGEVVRQRNSRSDLIRKHSAPSPLSRHNALLVISHPPPPPSPTTPSPPPSSLSLSLSLSLSCVVCCSGLSWTSRSGLGSPWQRPSFPPRWRQGGKERERSRGPGPRDDWQGREALGARRGGNIGI